MYILFIFTVSLNFNPNLYSKELVQNADDAGATELRVLYQGDTFNNEPPTRNNPFQKYFKVSRISFKYGLLCQTDVNNYVRVCLKPILVSRPINHSPLLF